ncbi:LysR substrate-binding domain-containing protein [Luteolibacter flavescens]|uniref:LysR substrate-binding domain-containing protein n=1 Tax=Luteolibacter flavescens TaxID=1859460 RepID=A0ABT3FU98_9BACT|nr:LysR family transcriptional regulator [Luteolibacter flavescens]MCW1887157.1 LysR substrate-binding domain-containing protein [Luteolibacter flavescens]
MRELKSFVLLAEQLHFGRASRLLNLSQPALTKQIRRMEDELGAPLFERGRHGTMLSSLGKQFLKEARGVVSGFDRLLDGAHTSARGESGNLSLGFGFHTLELVPRVIVKLRETSPGIQITLRDMSTAEQTDALRKGELDLGFVRLPGADDFKLLPVIKDRLTLVSSAAYPLPANATLGSCRDLPFVSISEARSPGFFGHFLQLCGKHSFHPRVVQQVPEFTTALALVQAGLGVTVIPQSAGTSRFPGLRQHPLRDRDAAWTVAAAWRKGDSNPALAKFLAILKVEAKRG